MNLWKITWRYSNRADYTSVETAGHANWLHERLHDTKRRNFEGANLLSVIAQPCDGTIGQPWEWLNPESEYHPAHAHIVSAAAQGI